MNPQLRDRIIGRLPELTEGTNCNATFFAILMCKNVLSHAEICQLEATGSSRGYMAESALFYEIIMTKDDSAYDALLEALKQTSQSFAASVLERPLTEETFSSSQQSRVAVSSNFQSKQIGEDEMSEIVECLRNSNSATAVFKKDWSYLATKLKIRAADKEVWDRELSQNLFDHYTLLIKMLTDWSNKFGSEATLKEFLIILKALQWNEFAEEVHNRFLFLNS